LELQEHQPLVEVSINLFFGGDTLLKDRARHVFKEFEKGKEVIAHGDLIADGEGVQLVLKYLVEGTLVLLHDVGEYSEDFQDEVFDLLSYHDLEGLGHNLNKIIRCRRAQDVLFRLFNLVPHLVVLLQDSAHEGIQLRMHLARVGITQVDEAIL